MTLCKVVKELNFYLPDFERLYGLNIETIRLLNNHPEYFIDNVNIGALYGCFPGQIWNGGRAYFGDMKYKDIEKIIHRYNELNIPIRFTYTNCLLEKQYLLDEYCNTITKIASESNTVVNEVLCNSPILEDYLREKYPNLKYILSTTRCERDITKINEYSEQYYLVVMDYRDNLNTEFLSQIEHPEKIEILLNPICRLECQTRKHHYEFVSQKQLGIIPEESRYKLCKCTKEHMMDSYVSTQFIKDYYIPNGFINFKLEGRAYQPQLVANSYVRYMIKPEYQSEVYKEIIMTQEEYEPHGKYTGE